VELVAEDGALKDMDKALQNAGWLLLFAGLAAGILPFPAPDVPFLPREPILLTLGAWLLSAQLFTIPYCRRFGGRALDFLSIGAAIGAILCAPLLPFLGMAQPAQSPLYHITLVAGVFIASLAAASFRSQGRYFHSARDLPELEGEKRAAAEAVLAKAGIHLKSIRVIPLGFFNAMVQGLRTCTIIVDRRATEALSTGEFAAMMAHEACHVRYGGILPYLALPPAFLAIANGCIAAGYEVELQLALLLGILLYLEILLCQGIETACDRFSARITTSGDTASLLRRIHGDMPGSVASLLGRISLSPLSSHPPLAVRLAAIGEGDRRDLVLYRAWRIIAAAVFFGVPCGLWIAAAIRPEVTPASRIAGWALPGLYTLLWFTWHFLILRSAKAHFRASLGESARGRWIRILTLIAVCFLPAIFAVNVFAPDFAWLPELSIGWLVALLLILIAGFFRGAFRSGLQGQPARLRKTVAECLACIQEGKPEEGLLMLEKVQDKHAENPWVLTLRASCFIQLDRLDEAAQCLSAVLEREKKFPLALINLALAELLRGDLPRAAELAGELTRNAPRDASAWHLRGLIALEAMKLDEAHDCFGKASDLKGGNAPALAGQALADLQGGRSPAEVEPTIVRARSLEPLDLTTLLASARWHQLSGDLDRGREDLLKAVARLREKGSLAYARHFEELGKKWGLLDGGETGR
jgi:Zn-dependent protease with chaperone function/Flp pilus assembly protein TadD